ncbi:3-phosphoserine/phosphohydroxythreonine transaminase [Sinimarinibacterium sp. NLF-5-8]|uniref:3-phosphoserine/phosphohydroxythreonine transaminase n=1 Tax=Sinimarinibacterium sp. NLF-5-8 TaxID=2698684 RepID=UPI00137BA9DE|nr:3-phosphoserine/phosphohydroxythreonine transaminase [Sinimarinibacterium sp. NLF-5-8]QHS09631.1 3-phosphoserine/phosphohydroxythreonine transaminase [Sinimarinibacterium sp. NLF-5-8]
MKRVFNFSAGPAMLPMAVLEQVQAELFDWNGSGMSVMEMSHRGKEFVSIAAAAEQDLRDLLNIPNNYKVLFMQGGATAQFSFIPMNLLRGKTSADFVVSGDWGKKAAKATAQLASANIAASSEADKYTYVPDRASWKLDPDAAFVHITSNETVHGVEFAQDPDVGAVPLVADMSSNILSRPVDVSRYGLIYAGAQKNIAPAGVTIVIVREDLLGQTLAKTPGLFDYQKVAENDSMINTPPCFAWYVAGLVFKHLKKLGGLDAMAAENARKSGLLYGYIDSQDFYRNPVRPQDRSRMNVPFTLAHAELDEAFLKGAKAAGLVTLKGHRSVGGMRASLYNAMPYEGVAALVDYMKEFVRTQG